MTAALYLCLNNSLAVMVTVGGINLIFLDFAVEVSACGLD